MIDAEKDPTMGPCCGCGVLGENCSVHHTACECEREICDKVICDDCRFFSHPALWAHFHEKDAEGNDIEDEYREVHIDCYHRMTMNRQREVTA